MNNTSFNQPLIAVDVVPVMFDNNGVPHVFLSQRLFEPFKGQYALPGVLLDGGESLAEAALRALKTKAGFHADYLVDIGFFDNPARDPRNKVVSVAFLALVHPGFWEDAHHNTFEYARYPLSVDMFSGDETGFMSGSLPFDHYSIISKARDVLAKSFLNPMEHEMNHAIFRAIEGYKLPVTSAVVMQCAQTLGVPVSSSNIVRKLENLPFVVRGQSVPTGFRGKPPVTWEVTNPISS